MNISTTRSGIAASALLLAFATATPLLGQSPPHSNNPQDKSQDKDKGQDKDFGSNSQGKSSQQGQFGQQSIRGMEQINTAYKQLHQITLSTLQEQARTWQDKPASGSSFGSTRGTDSSTRGTDISTRGTDSSSTPISLRGDELLIAACSGGLLAGAPSGPANFDARKSGTPGSNDSKHDNDNKFDSKNDNKQGSQSNPDRSNQGTITTSNEGQSVGMLLVHSNSGSSMSGSSHGSTGGSMSGGLSGDGQKSDRDSRDTREASGDRETNVRNASGILSAGPLKPGVYCVKQSGSSVWLTDQEGQVVLRTSLDSQRANKTPKAGEFGQERESELALQRLGNQGGDWEQVFGAIAMEARDSMGWAKQGSVASIR